MNQIVDQRGNLFGRFNIIDVAALVVVIVLVPMAFVTYRVFRQPLPVITSVTPSSVSVDSLRRVRLHGEHFRPFMNAFVAKSGEPFGIPQRVPETVQATFLIETPTEVELRLPDVGPGTYDIYLYDEGRELTHKAAAVTLTPGERAIARAGEPLPDQAIADFHARFSVYSEIVPLVKVDAVELNKPDTGNRAMTPARLIAVKKAESDRSSVALALGEGGRLIASVSPAFPVLEVDIRAGVTQDHGLWVYPVEQKIRVGEAFTFATADYLMRGVITHVTAIRPSTGPVIPSQ